MPPSSQLSPLHASELLGIHANTVRLWCTEYAEFLSESAKSRPRLLSASDVAVLQLVQQLRTEGHPRSEVLQRLRETPEADRTAPYIETVSAQPTEATETPTSALAAPAVDVSALLLSVAELVDARSAKDVKALDERLRKIEAQRLWWVAVSVGVVAGIVLGVILAVLLRP